jgi:hypothetical protein
MVVLGSLFRIFSRTKSKWVLSNDDARMSLTKVRSLDA